MGEAKLKASATKNLISKHPHCYFCGGTRTSATREHMPPKALFDNSHRPDKLIMPACAECNRDTSTADLVAAIVSRWHYDSPESEREDHRRLIAQVRMQHPQLRAEWTSLRGPVERKRARQHLRSYGVPVPHDAGVVTIGPETVKYLHLFAHKAVLALYFEHFQQPLPKSGGMFAVWKTKEDFILNGIPDELLRIVPKFGTLVQGKWDTSETFAYRYDENLEDGLFGCFAKLRKGLFVIGFAENSPSILTSDITDSPDWVHPDDVQNLLSLERFKKSSDH